MDAALHLPRLDALNVGMNTVDQTLATRSGERGVGRRQGKVRVDLANTIWGQQAITWPQTLLETLAADYGTGVHQADFVGDASGARRTVNRWISDATRGRITDLATPEMINADTRLAWSTPSTSAVPGTNRWTSPGRVPSPLRAAPERCR